MLSTDDHGDVLRHVTVSDLPAIARAQDAADVAASLVTAALRAAGVESDQVTVIPTMTANHEPAVVVVTRGAEPSWRHFHDADLMTRVLPSRAAELAQARADR
jgi:hypothetical protein